MKLQSFSYTPFYPINFVARTDLFCICWVFHVHVISFYLKSHVNGLHHKICTQMYLMLLVPCCLSLLVTWNLNSSSVKILLPSGLLLFGCSYDGKACVWPVLFCSSYGNIISKSAVFKNIYHVYNNEFIFWYLQHVRKAALRNFNASSAEVLCEVLKQ